MSITFAKYEGLGNDFVIVDEQQWSSASAKEPQLASDVRMNLCDRHRGVGGDGVLTVMAPRVGGAVARMHITNADGSVPEMCGNGLRCVALYLVHAKRLHRNVEVSVDTDAGVRRVTVLDDVDGQGSVRVEMGPAKFHVEGQIPKWHGEALVVDGMSVKASAVSMGNPHVVLDIDPTLAFAKRIGPLLEHHERFPQRTNVELAKVRDDGSVDVVVWERGVGITQACGTGACGVAAVLARAGKIPYDKDVVVRLPGGPLVVNVPKDEARSVWMTGAARRVFSGVA